jgi:hypothetical protein
MDLSQYLRVVRRFWGIVVVGVLLAVLLGVLSLVKIDLASGKVSYRGSERWASTASVFVTQKGFPLGRSIYDEVIRTSDTTSVSRFNDPSRFASYAQLYAQIASSDLLRSEMRKGAPPRGSVSAAAGTDVRNPGIVLPLVEITGTGQTAKAAQHATTWATRSLIDYIQQQQAANKIAPGKRVILRILDQPSPPTLIAGRSKTRPVFIFLAVLTACAALIFTLDNLKRPTTTQHLTRTEPLTEPQQLTPTEQPQTAVGRWSRGARG